MLKLFLWLRYLRKIKILFLSIAAIALSVSLLIVVSSLFTGFIKTFEQAAVDAMGDVVIMPPESIPKYNVLIENLEKTGTVEAATAMISGYGLLHVDRGIVRAVEIWGIEPERRERVTGFDRYLIRKRSSNNQTPYAPPAAAEQIDGFVGIGLLTEPNQITDEYDYKAALKMLDKKIQLTTGSASTAQVNNRSDFKRKLITFTIADVVETGVYQFDSGYIYLPIEQLSKILYPDKTEPVADQIQIKLADNADVDVALAEINGVWRTFVEDQLNSDIFFLRYTDIVTTSDLQSMYIAEFRKQMGVLLVIFNIVSFGAVLLIFCIFYMIVRIKRKDIAILKSCGSSGSSIASIFVGFGAFIGVIGAGAGMGLGYLITCNINTIEQWIRIIFGLKLWKSSVYLFNRIPNEVDWPWAVLIAGLAIVAAAIGSLIPAVKAALTKPVEILRYE
jgi:lipoprotein-releasing system permease protein